MRTTLPLACAVAALLTSVGCKPLSIPVRVENRSQGAAFVELATPQGPRELVVLAPGQAHTSWYQEGDVPGPTSAHDEHGRPLELEGGVVDGPLSSVSQAEWAALAQLHLGQTSAEVQASIPGLELGRSDSGEPFASTGRIQLFFDDEQKLVRWSLWQ